MSERTDSHDPSPEVRSAIRLIRKQRVILDADLAHFYGVTTKRLNEAVKRNRDRFPEDFAFQLTDDENAAIRRKASDHETQPLYNKHDVTNWSQLATSSTAPMRSQFATAPHKRNIRPLLLSPPDPPRKAIGFSVRERRARYRTAGRITER